MHVYRYVPHLNGLDRINFNILPFSPTKYGYICFNYLKYFRKLIKFLLDLIIKTDVNLYLNT